jgi:Cyclin, N-terminal domain/Cyclin, C-terminal domain
MNYVPELYTNERQGISKVMRYALVNRLAEVQRKLLLDNETLHLCVNIIDRYCALKNNARGGHNKVTKRSFHLVGLTALLIASKYEEIWALPISECIKVCDYQYDAQDFLDMEYDILQALKYRISGPTAFPFLQRFLHLTNATTKMSYAATYYLERALHLEEFLNFRPSLVAAAAVCLAINNSDIRRLDRRRCKRVGIVRYLVFL